MILETLEILKEVQHREGAAGVEREPSTYDLLRAIRKVASALETFVADVDADLAAIRRAVGAGEN